MREAALGLGLSARVAELLVGRGIARPEELAAFFAEGATGLHDPRRLPDAELFAARIRRARARGETVMVFGDFDADGLTGLAILTLALQRLGIAVDPYIPSRLEEGHGLSLAALERARTIGAALIVTVDCGSTSVAEIDAAREAGIDVLVTDHHRVPERLPNALAIVNPQRPDSSYPDPRLAGSGVAFKLAQLLLADAPGGPEAALDLADLAIVGAVADVAPILGENRAIARLGLERLRSAARPGFAALLERAGVAPAATNLETVAFALAPRLNAAGRVGEALEAARLLLASTREEAEALAVALETANRARRDLTRTAVEEARAAVLEQAPDAPAIVVRGPWPVGIVGLVASRLAEDLNRPAVVGAHLGEVVRASCRSDGSLDLARALGACSDLFIRHGGHRGAAGFEIPADRWPAFTERFLVIAGLDAPADRRTVARLDLAVPATEVTYDLHRELAALAPCGPGNPDPLVAVLGLTVTRVRPANGGHTQLTLRRVRDVLDGIAFDRPDLAESVSEGDRLDVVGRIMSRRFGGFETLQIEIRDVAPSGHHPEARAILEREAAPVAAGGAA
jgi:single-stranded-DNA-specific exonuclease